MGAPTKTPTERYLVDTGAFVALFDAKDPAHGGADAWFARMQGELHTVDSVLTETAFFLGPALRANLAELAANGVIHVHHPDATGLRRMAALLRKYSDLDPDWADVSLVWLAEVSGIHRIATLDVRDFSTYRIHGRRKFVLESLQ